VYPITKRFHLPGRQGIQFAILAVGVGLFLGTASLISSPLTVLLCIFLLLFFAAISCRPEAGLLAILFLTSGLVDPGRLPLLPAGPFSLHLADGILLFLLAKVALKALTHPGLPARRTPLDFPLLWFYLAVLLSAGTAMLNPSFETDWVLRQVRPLTYYLSFFCVTHLFEKKRQVSFLIKGCFAIAIAASLVMLVQAIYPSFQLASGRSAELVTAGQRFEGVERSYLQVDRLVYFMFVISVCFLVARTRFLPSLVEFARAGLLGAGLFFTFQRNYWLSAGAMLVFMGLLVTGPARIRMIRRGVAAAAVLVLLLSCPAVSQHRYVMAAWNRLTWGMRLETLARDGSVHWRGIETRHAFESFAQHPLLGVGLRNFYRPAYPRDREIQPNGLRWYVHNAYLWVLVDMGAFGFLPFTWFYAAAIWRGLARWRTVGDVYLRALTLGITLGVLGQAITNLVAPNFFQSWALAVFPILLGVREVILRGDSSGSCPNLQANPGSLDCRASPCV
jgi:O-antigen ligase